MSFPNFPNNPTFGQEYSYAGKTWVFDGTGWGLLLNGGGGRTRLTENTSFFVRSGGSDTTGDALTADTAVATPNKAYDIIRSNYDLAGFLPTIDVGAGSFANLNVTQPLVGGGKVNLTGAGSGSSTITSSDDAVQVTDVPVIVSVSGFTISAPTASQNGFLANGAGAKIIGVSDIIFSGVSAFAMRAGDFGAVQMTGSFSLSGNMQGWINCSGGKVSINGGLTITLVGTPAWSTAGINFFLNGQVSILPITIVGSATGKRYNGDGNATIYSFGQGTASTFFPGNVDGTLTNDAVQA